MGMLRTHRLRWPCNSYSFQTMFPFAVTGLRTNENVRPSRLAPQNRFFIMLCMKMYVLFSMYDVRPKCSLCETFISKSVLISSR